MAHRHPAVVLINLLLQLLNALDVLILLANEIVHVQILDVYFGSVILGFLFLLKRVPYLLQLAVLKAQLLLLFF